MALRAINCLLAWGQSEDRLSRGRRPLPLSSARSAFFLSEPKSPRPGWACFCPQHVHSSKARQGWPLRSSEVPQPVSSHWLSCALNPSSSQASLRIRTKAVDLEILPPKASLAPQAGRGAGCTNTAPPSRSLSVAPSSRDAAPATRRPRPHQLYVGHLVVWFLQPDIPVIPLPVGTCWGERNFTASTTFSVHPIQEPTFLERDKHR